MELVTVGTNAVVVIRKVGTIAAWPEADGDGLPVWV